MALFPTDLLIELVGRKHQVLVELCELGRRQLAHIASEEMSELLGVLSAKQHLITALQATERELDPFRDQQPEQRPWRSAAQRTRCGELLAQCEALLAEIVEQEKRSEQQLRIHRDSAAARLQGAHTAGAALQAYVEQPSAPTGQLDLCSEY
jgi:hypothetical protein